MTKRRLAISIVASAFTLSSWGQSVIPVEKASFITRFPIRQLTGGVVLIQARLDTISEKLNFILDTGSGGISLDSATVEEFGLPHAPSGRTINGIAGTRQVDYSRNHQLHFPGLTVDSLDFYINDYDLLSRVYGLKIDGIIGYSFLKDHIVKLNYDSLYMEVFTPGEISYPKRGTTLRPMFTALPIQNLKLKDARKISANFYIDTGAGLCFLVSRQFQEDSSLIKEKRKPVTIQVQGLGGKKQMELTFIRRLSIGPYTFNKVPTNILDDEYNAISYPFIGGVIGNDILRRFNVILNYPKREIHIVPNSHYHDLFDYSYTGMNLYYFDGKIYTDEIIEGSPADKAGIKKDDVIMGVNSNFSNDITVYKELMNVAGRNVSLVILRDGEPLLINFKVGKIY